MNELGGAMAVSVLGGGTRPERGGQLTPRSALPFRGLCRLQTRKRSAVGRASRQDVGD